MQDFSKTPTEPQIDRRLLWEYDLKSFDFNNSYQVVIERIIARGDLHDWREMARFYPKALILNVAEKSKQLSEKDKGFTPIFLDSHLLYAFSE